MAHPLPARAGGSVSRWKPVKQPVLTRAYTPHVRASAALHGRSGELLEEVLATACALDLTGISGEASEVLERQRQCSSAKTSLRS